MGKRLTQLESIANVDKEHYLLIDGEDLLQSKKAKLKDINLSSFKNDLDIPTVDIKVDGNFNPNSDNPQSGKAVAEALAVAKDYTNAKIDQTYTPDSENAQSGKAVAEAVATEQKRSDNTFANALKGSKSGSAILIDDISPVTHEIGVKVRGKNLLNLSNREIVTNIYSSNTDVRSFNGNQLFIGISANNYFATSNIVSYSIGETITVTAKQAAYGLGYDVAVKQNTSYVFSSIITNGEIRVGLYNKDGTYSRTIEGTNTFTTNSTEYWAVILLKQLAGNESIEASFTDIQLELGTIATAYTPYVPDLTAVKVSRCGKNLFSLANRTWANFGAFANTTVRNINKDNFYFRISANNYAGNLTTDYEIIDGNSIKITTSNAYGLGVPLNLIAGQQYTISCIKSDNKKCQINVGYYDIEGNWLSLDSNISTFTIPENAHWTILCFVATNTQKAEELTFTNIQLELGSTATEYEPYKECAEYTPTADGTVNGVTSLYPNTILTTDTDGVIIDCEYNRDVNKSVQDVMELIKEITLIEDVGAIDILTKDEGIELRDTFIYCGFLFTETGYKSISLRKDGGNSYYGYGLKIGNCIENEITNGTPYFFGHFIYPIGETGRVLTLGLEGTVNGNVDYATGISQGLMMHNSKFTYTYHPDPNIFAEKIDNLNMFLVGSTETNLIKAGSKIWLFGRRVK